ncbi:LysR family transcriptional regulator [Mucilaginibacter pedocola]|uniref:LysR family transcriptional regulator n=1 Tax=Mucilaginibacter pedocola TaxID=1792845 RepID=A0A1S9PKG4_9SPHI|nr:LysR family transcriptional regulator [Mucilaginibacter pedocola]OOQ61409.1 LysR family transcriptional regulator [Mucilaginibacter pedocola]
MNTNDLKIFEAVIKHYSFTKAAETMFTVQSNVTARIKNLEEEFGAPLFIRNARKITLTPAGEILSRYSKQMIHLVEEARNEIQSADSLSGHLKIGCIETTMVLKVPDLLNRFADIHPGVDLEFKSAMRADLIKDVLNYTLDAAFVPAPISIAGLNSEPVSEDELIILAPTKTESLQAVQGQQAPVKIIVFDEGCVFRTRLESWLSAHGIIQYKPLVVNSLEGVVNFVEAGLGISLLPAEIIERYYSERNIKTFAIAEALGRMSTVLISRNNVAPTKALNEFINVFRAGLASLAV